MSHKRLVDIGRHLASRTRGRRLRAEVLREIETTGSPCTIDLTDVQSVSDSFADEFFAVLAADYGDVWFRQNIQVRGACDVVRAAIVRAIGARLERAAVGPTQPRPKGFVLAPPPAELPR